MTGPSSVIVRTRKELESFIGNLKHACKVAPQGCTFLCRKSIFCPLFGSPTTQLGSNENFVWTSPGGGNSFDPGMANYKLFSYPLPDFQFLSDPAGTIGNGTIFPGEWFISKWTQPQEQLSIAYKVLLAVIISALLWGHQWAQKWVEFCSTIMGVVEVLHSSDLAHPENLISWCSSSI